MIYKSRNSLISLFLIFIMLFSFIPVFAEGEEIPVLKVEDGFGMFEVEDMLVDTTGWKPTEDENASGGIYLKPIKYPTTTDALKTAFGGEDATKLYFDLEEEGYYTIWVRANYMWGSDGNYWVNLDGTTASHNFSNCDRFTWNSIKTAKFKAGRHYIGLSPRRSNVGVDKILITNSEYYAPSGFGMKPPPFTLGKEGETLADLYFSLPSFVPPAEHPRLFVRSENLPKIKENLTHPDHIAIWEEVQRIANQERNCKMTSTAEYSLDQTIHEYLECCAFMYLLDKEKNKDYGLKAINGLIDYITTLNYSGEGGMVMARSGIILTIAKIYDWCYDLLTNEMKEIIIPKGLVIMTKLESGWPPTQMDVFSSGHASENGIQVDSMSFAIATYEDYPNIWNAVAGRFFEQYVSVNNYYYDLDHYQAEGDSYGPGRHTYDSIANSMLTVLGLGGMISDNEHYLPYNVIYRRRPDGAYLQMGDMWRTSLSEYDGSSGSLLSASNRYKDPYLKYERYRLEEMGTEVVNGSGGYSLVCYLILDDVDIPLADYNDLPLTWYSGTGHNLITTRTGWEDGITSDVMVVSLNGGGRSRGGHQHFDNGNFEIYYKGPLALDAGVYNGKSFVDDNGNLVTATQAGSYHDRNYHKMTIAHNCILIYDPNENLNDAYYYGAVLNSGGQQKSIPGDSYEDMISDKHIFAERVAMDYGPDLRKPDYTYLKTDLTKSYGYRAEDYTRAFTFLNFFDETYPGALIVFDKVTSSDANFKKTWLLHSQEEPVIEGNITKIDRTEYGYNGRLINETLLPKAEDSVFEIIGGEGKEYWVAGENVKAVNIVKGDESGKWRVELSPKKAKTTDYFLNVLHPFDADDTIPPLKSEYYETDDYVGVKIKDRVVYLSKTTNLVSKTTTISAEGEEEKLYYMIDGIKEGRWQVTDKNGKKVAECDVTGVGAVAYFEAPPGKYTLEKMRGYKDIPEKDYDLFKNIAYGENEISPKLMYNGMYQLFESPLLSDENGVLVPFDEMMKIMDNESKITREGDKVSLVFEDNTYDFKIGDTTVDKTYAFYGKPEEIKLESSLKLIDGVIYMPQEYVSKLFEKKFSYSQKSKISRIENTFKRPKDYIVNSNDAKRIAVASTEDKDSALNTAAYMALDGDTGTRWGTQTHGAYAIYEFKEVSDLSHIKVAWYNGHIRDYKYEFYVSENGTDYKKVLEGNSGVTGDYTSYDIGEKNVKFFKVVAYGNTVNDFFNINEIMFFNSK